MTDDINLDTSNEERLGVLNIGAAFEELGWSFRERGSSDFGIDADVEQKINGKRTNSHIALQIKSGKSFCTIKKNNKITFRIEDKHFYYWLSSDRPVLITVYDKESKKIYWEQIRLPLIKLNKSKDKRYIEIPASKELNASSLDELNRIIDTYVPHFEYSISEEDIIFDNAEIYLTQYRTGIEELVNKLQKFREDINAICLSPNTDKLKIYIELFTKTIKDHTEEDYKNLKKAWFYLAYLVFLIPNQVRQNYANVIDNNIENLLLQKASWLYNIDNLKKLLDDVFPHKIHYVANRLIQLLEQYVSLIELSIEDFLTCKLKNETFINGKTENAKS